MKAPFIDVAPHTPPYTTSHCSYRQLQLTPIARWPFSLVALPPSKTKIVLLKSPPFEPPKTYSLPFLYTASWDTRPWSSFV